MRTTSLFLLPINRKEKENKIKAIAWERSNFEEKFFKMPFRQNWIYHSSSGKKKLSMDSTSLFMVT